MHDTANLRLATIPVEHICAEIAAYPIASENALTFSNTSLQPMMNDEAVCGASETAELWRGCESELLRAAAGLSVDEIVSLRDRIWFGNNSDRPVPFALYLQRASRLHLKIEGDSIRPRLINEGDRSGRAAQEPIEISSRREWRWLSFALPPDLFLAAFGSFGEFPVRIRTMSATIERMLMDRGFPESHLHLGAGMEFSTLWIALQHSLATPNLSLYDAFKAPGAAFDNGKNLASWLLRVAISRCLISAYLKQTVDTPGSRITFATFQQRFLVPLLRHRFGIASVAQLQLALHRFAAGLPCLAEHDQTIRAIYRHLAKPVIDDFYRSSAGKSLDVLEFQHFDPLSQWSRPVAGGRVTPEMQMIAKGIRYLRRSESSTATKTKQVSDLWFERMFWQTIRVRNIFYRHIVQRPLTPGLQAFVRFYARISPARGKLSKSILLSAAARTSGYGHGLRSLEVRTSAPPNWSILNETVELRNAAMKLKKFSKPLSNSPPFEAGVAFHFSRVRQGGAEVGRPNAFGSGTTAQPGFSSTQHRGGMHQIYRFANLYNERANEARAVSRLLWSYPLSLELVRGVDTCTDEIGVPTWVIAPLFRYVREASDLASQMIKRALGCSVPAISSAPHGGEDFVHLASGLRRIDETVEFLGLQQGDRLGHGLALGVDARYWASSVSKIALSREEILWNLVWEHRLTVRNSKLGDAGRSAHIETEIERLSSRIFGEPLSALDLSRLLVDLHDEDVLRRVGFPHGPVPNIELGVNDRHRILERHRRLSLVVRYLTDVGIYFRGSKTEWMYPSQEAETLFRIQRYLQEKIAQIGITLEVNPTSNLLVGDIGDLTRHPLWRLHPPDELDAPLVSVCVGSDDPVTFSSRLLEEYVLLHDSLVAAGQSNEVANRWIERVRRSGMDARFTLPASLSNELNERVAMLTSRSFPEIEPAREPFGGFLGRDLSPNLSPLP